MKQLQNGRLNRDIEGGGRLIQNEQIRGRGKRARIPTRAFCPPDS